MKNIRKRNQKYLTEIKWVLNNFKKKEFEFLWTRETKAGEWHSISSIIKYLAFLHAVVYHKTGCKSNLKLAKKFLLDYCHKNTDGAEHFAAIFTGKCYEIIKDSLSTEEQSLFKKQWLNAAKSTLETFVDIKNLNTQPPACFGNHPICACVFADYVRSLFPEESREYHFESVTDKVWNIWWRQREFQEQATNYEGFAEVFLCFWAELRGVKKEFYRSPSIQNMFRRNLGIVSPAGIVTAYADSGHYEHACTWLALFEKIAQETGNNLFSETAFQIFTCLKKVGWKKQKSVIEKYVKMNNLLSRYTPTLYVNMVAYLGLAVLWSDNKAGIGKPISNGIHTRLPIGYFLSATDKKKLPEKKMIPYQISLCGGDTDPAKQTYLLMSVGPKINHDHADAGSILLLSKGTTCFLGTNGYLQRELIYHNCFYVQKASLKNYPEDSHEQVFTGDPNFGGIVDELQINDHSSYCRITFKRYHGFPLSLVRECFLDHDGNVILVDKVEAHKSGLCGGLLLHGEAINKINEHTFKLRINSLTSFNGIEWVNGPGKLQVQMMYPDPEITIRNLKIPQVYSSPAYSRFPCSDYHKVWKKSYTARKCLASRNKFSVNKQMTFVTKLILP